MNPYKTYRNVYEFQELETERISNFQQNLQEYEKWNEERTLDRLIVGKNEQVEAENVQFKEHIESQILLNRQRDYKYELLDTMMDEDVKNLQEWQNNKKENHKQAVAIRKEQELKEYAIKSKL